MPSKGGYLIGNLQSAHMDFRFFSLRNLWSIISSLATADQSHGILDLIEAKWAELVADMPFKICYPALEGQDVGNETLTQTTFIQTQRNITRALSLKKQNTTTHSYKTASSLT